MVNNRSMDSTNISFEIFKGDKINFANFNEDSEDYFYLLSKVGTPVFTAFDPSPYDPLNERDTLTTGSLTEIKTNRVEIPHILKCSFRHIYLKTIFLEFLSLDLKQLKESEIKQVKN